jgi:predicted tellurium resistance membrane protein TerC
MFDHFFTFLTLDTFIAFLTLVSLEIILGIDNVIFIAIVANRLPLEQRNKARVLGLTLAVITRVIFLLSISFIMRLKEPLIILFNHPISIKDMILIGGGLFLIGKTTIEIHHKLEEVEKKELQGNPLSSSEDKKPDGAKQVSFVSIIIQILLLDIIFSIDSVITAVGMVKEIGIMISAVLISTFAMILFSKSIVSVINKHPTLKMLALSFLMLIGVLLIVEGFGKKIDKGYIYFAMGFSLMVEMLNMRITKSRRSQV